MNGTLDLKVVFFACFVILQVNNMNICHKNYFDESLCSSYTQRLFGLYGFLFATWMDVTVNGNCQRNFFSKFA